MAILDCPFFHLYQEGRSAGELRRVGAALRREFAERALHPLRCLVHGGHYHQTSLRDFKPGLLGVTLHG